MPAGGSIALSIKEDNTDLINQNINQIQQGHLNCVVTGTLTANATSTIIKAQTCTTASAIVPCPLTADAAPDLGLMWFVPSVGQFTVNHASNANVDRTFAFIIIG